MTGPYGTINTGYTIYSIIILLDISDNPATYLSAIKLRKDLLP
jgi:hypothetical protein